LRARAQLHRLLANNEGLANARLEGELTALHVAVARRNEAAVTLLLA
jgi:hypothetical protein